MSNECRVWGSIVAHSAERAILLIAEGHGVKKSAELHRLSARKHPDEPGVWIVSFTVNREDIYDGNG